MRLEDAQEGRRYKVTWNDRRVEGNFKAILVSKNYDADDSDPEPFLHSVTFGNGVTLSGNYGYDLEET